MHTIGEKQSVYAAMKALGSAVSIEDIQKWIQEHEGEAIAGDPMGLKVETMSLELIRLNRKDLLLKEIARISQEAGEYD